MKMEDPIGLLLKCCTFSGLAVGGTLFGLYWFSPDPFKTKPVPALDAFKKELERLAEVNDEKYKIYYDDDDSNVDLTNIRELPSRVRGNIYRAVLELDKYLAKEVDFIDMNHHNAAYSWDPAKEPFMVAFCREVQKPSWLYLKKVKAPRIL